MTRTTILEVRSAAGSAELAGAAIDVPAAGDVRADWTLDVRGWVAGGDVPVTGVEAVHEGQRLWRVPLDVERPRTAAELGMAGDRIGFHALGSSLRLAPEFDVEVRALLEAGGHVVVGNVHGRRAPLRTSFEARRRPVLVTTLGRTGSMLLLRLLAAHPEVVVYRPHRFEQRIANYWADALLALAEPAAHIRQVAPAGDLDDPAWWLGRDAPVPWPLRDAAVQEWLGGEALERLAESFQEQIEATYDRIVATTDTPDAGQFAEKCSLRAANLLTELYPGARELFLVRDFRDMVSSIIAFNSKRGVRGFGRASASSDADYVASLAGWATALLRAWERRQGTAHLVRYEDLVSDPERAVAGVLSYLGVDPGAAAALVGRLAEEMPELREHRTSEAAGASVGRWRRDLAPELVSASERAFGPALAAFGYD